MRKLSFVILAATLLVPTTILAQPSSDPKIAALTQTLQVTMAKAEQHAAAAAFPRKNILAAVSRSVWETFYHGDYTSAEEAAAVDAVASTSAATSIVKEAATRMKYELQLN